MIFTGIIPWCLVLREDLYGPMALKICQRVFPKTGIGPWMALPSYTPNSKNKRCKCKCNCSWSILKN